MKSGSVPGAALAGLAYSVNAKNVSISAASGSAEGFASGVTGDGDATQVYPAVIDELISYLTLEDPRVIVLSKTYHFTDAEGTITETGCAICGTGEGCQTAIDVTGSWCSSNYPSVQVTYNEAAMEGINVALDKTIIGTGSEGILKGKGMKFVNNISNIIVQNIHFIYLNPQYVWGGDAFSFDGSAKNTGIKLFNNCVNGQTQWSAGCDGDHHYWTIELLGSGDQITLQNNCIRRTSGRGPAISSTTLLHAVNSVWSDISGYTIEGDLNGAKEIFEGCVFEDVDKPLFDDFAGQIFASSDESTTDQCESVFGRACLLGQHRHQLGLFWPTRHELFP